MSQPTTIATAPRTNPLAQSTKPTVREVVLDLLRSFNMTTIFGNPGSTELPLFLDFPDDFNYKLGLQEAIVVGMADGYAQATRNAAFINLHSAAGVGNAMGNIFTAFKNSTPLVITAGQQARSILPFDPFLYSAQATELPKPYVKWSVEPARAEDVPLAIARAYYIAMQQPRGPVLVSIPADDWSKPCDYVQAREVSTAIAPEPRLLEKMAGALNACQSPVFVIGDGVDRDGAWDLVVELAERHNARVWTAPMSGRSGFPGDHALFAGYLPAMREKIVSLLNQHDLILVLGAPAFTYHIEGSGPHVPAGAVLYQMIDDANIAAWTPEGSSIVCSIDLGVKALLARPAPAKRSLPQPRQAPPRAEPTMPMSPAYLLQTLDEVRDRNAIIVEESPSSRPIMHQYMPIYHSETFYTCASGGLGHSLPAAVGVALAKPGKKVIGLMGDGSSMYSIQALWSAAQLKLPITFIIVKNRRYAALQEFAPTFGFKPDSPLEGCDLPDIDFVALAKGQGCEAVHVGDPAQLHDVLRNALASPLPILVEVDVA
ncbi:MAG TPA: benzoylformate decarboxylase [Eoetvoesiella sp.]